jgi:hypothetical protein
MPTSSVEDDLIEIERYLFQTYQLDPDTLSTSMHYNCISLKPLSQLTFSLGVIGLNSFDFDRLSEIFSKITASKILLDRESNLFFDMISSAEYLEQRS